ncbi:hypothetical protein T06_6012 [Trichinella sp. T6]|nr:hypothetical protein T06_6012 [Trichinella sp. T6]
MQSSLPGVITIASFPFGPGFPGIPFSPSKPGSPGIPGGPIGPLGHLFSVRMLHWHLRLFIGFSRYGSEESLFVVAIFCTNSVRPLSTNSLCPGGNGILPGGNTFSKAVDGNDPYCLLRRSAISNVIISFQISSDIS